MRFILFSALYISVGMAIWQSAGWLGAGLVLVAVFVPLLMAVMGATFGVFGGKQ